MKNRKIMALLFAAALVPVTQAHAEPHDHDGNGPWFKGQHHGGGDWHGGDRHGDGGNRHPDFRPAHFGGPAPHWQAPAPHWRAPEPHWGPGRYRIMPPGYKTVIAAGVTYFVLNELWYRMNGGVYQQVQAPAANNITIINGGNTNVISSGMNVVDVNGIRYYVQNGHYYRRDTNGEYLEIAPPAGMD